MKDWTDDELGALLTETFASREGAADPAAARRIGHAIAPRRRWPTVLAAAAVVAAVVAGTVLLAGTDERRADPTAPQPPPTPTLATDADHQRLTRLEAQRLIREAPVPPGATRLGRPPTWPGPVKNGLYASVEHFEHTSFYTVTSSSEAVQEYLLEHQPTGMRKQRGGGIGLIGRTHYFAYAVIEPRQPMAMTSPRLLVQWTEQGGRTLLRFDTELAARFARPADSFATGTVTSVDFDRTKNVGSGTAPTVTITDPAEISRLVDLVNNLPGTASPFGSATGHHCPVLKHPSWRSLTFHTATGLLAFRIDQAGCGFTVQVRRDGRRVGPDLEANALYRVFEDLQKR